MKNWRKKNKPKNYTYKKNEIGEEHNRRWAVYELIGNGRKQQKMFFFLVS
jgi:hypothetical protein